jgi:hypothetical protein
MKKVFTLGLLTLGFIYQQANAQIGKGEKMLGGSVGFTSSKTEYKNSTAPESKNNTVTITPQIGFGLGNNWIVGIGLGYSSSNSEMDNFGSTAEYKSYVVSPGLFVRKFHTFGDKFGIFGQADAEYVFGKGTSKQTNQPTYESDIKGYNIAVSPGAFYKASKRIVIEATVGSLGYTSLTTKPEGSNVEVTNSQFNLSLTNSLSLGFRLIF